MKKNVKLMRRGEDINAQCGPFGTVLHSIVDGIPQNFALFTSSVYLLDIFLQNGANINAAGPYGNALEFLWKIANTDEQQTIASVCGHRDVMRHLIKRGAVNNQPDPNGLIPSIDYMENWPGVDDERLDQLRGAARLDLYLESDDERLDLEGDDENHETMAFLKAYKECRRYYLHGPRDSNAMTRDPMR